MAVSVVSLLPSVGDSVNSSIDLSSDRDDIVGWTQRLSFKLGEAGKHFKKHKEDWPLKQMGINTREDYVRSSRENIVNSIFEKGFVIRTAVGNRVACFTVEGRGDFPDKMTALGSFHGVGRLMTFYSANRKTPSLTIRNFSSWPAYIAHFEKGVSKEGWQIINYHPFSGIETLIPGVPEEDLDESINLLSIRKC